MITVSERLQQQLGLGKYNGQLAAELNASAEQLSQASLVSETVSDKVVLGQADLESTEALLKKNLFDSFAGLESTSQITISPASVSPVFNPRAEEMAVNFVTRNVQQGLAEGKSAENLTNILNASASSVRSAYSNTSQILDALGQLGPAQRSFLSRSEHQVERGLTGITELISRQDSADSDGQLFELSVQTQEGDTVTLKFSSSLAYDESAGVASDSFQLEYEVDGELSEQEHQALQAIYWGVGELADQYFHSSGAGGSSLISADFATDILKDFDAGQLADIDFSIGKAELFGNKRHQDSDRLDFSYSYDNAGQNQRLEFNWKPVNGVGSHFDIDMSTIGGQDQRQLSEYLNLIDSSYQASKPGEGSILQKLKTPSVDMYKTALTSMFGIADQYSALEEQAADAFANGRELVTDLTNQLIHHDKRYQPLKQHSSALFQDGISNLADFKSSFSFGGSSMVGNMQFELEQKSTVMKSSEHQAVSQNKRFESQTLVSKADASLEKESISANYQVKAAIDGLQVVALDQQRDYDREALIRSNLGSGIYSRKTIDEQIQDSSSLRLIENIWTQSVEHNAEKSTKTEIYYGKELHSTSLKRDSANEQTMTLIADMDKLRDKKFMGAKYAPALAHVNRLMAEV